VAGGADPWGISCTRYWQGALMDATRWEQLVSGNECPFDVPRPDSNEHWDVVGSLKTSTLYLTKSQTYRGHCLLIFDVRHATRPDQLSMDEWTSFCADLYRAGGVISHIVKPDHINVAALGNVIPHLHWHIVPRYYDDPRWGAPIWMTNLEDMDQRRLCDAEHGKLLRELKVVLAS